MDSSDEEVIRSKRTLPNILITGTPGTGKTSTSEVACDMCGARRLCVGEVVKAEGFHEGQDEFGAMLIDEDPLLDWMEEDLKSGGVIVEHHGSALFPERWFDAVVVLTTDNTLLYDRLAARGYPQAKITQNVECEIMQVLLDEARESYREDIVHVRPSNSSDDLRDNAAFVAELYQRISQTLQ